MKKKVLKYLAIGGTTLCLGLSILTAPTATLSAEAAVPETAEINKNAIEWVYLKAEGCLYRRLYNYSTGMWIGDWIFVRYLVDGK